MAYATIADIQARSTRTYSADEQRVCQNLLDDAAILIDRFNASASNDVKKVVSCRVVIRALGSSGDNGVPIGATQGSMAALGYSQSWTLSGSGASGELYLSKTEKQLLGGGSSIGSYSPTEALVPEMEE